jgi:hypothetical protein
MILASLCIAPLDLPWLVMLALPNGEWLAFQVVVPVLTVSAFGVPRRST